MFGSYSKGYANPDSDLSSSLLQEAREKAASIAKASLQIFIVFIFVIILMLIFYLIKRRKPEILHRRALIFPNRDEGEQCGDDSFLVHFNMLL